MTDTPVPPIDSSLRRSLHENEKSRYDFFYQVNGRHPETIWELMCWSAQQEEISRQNREFWCGVFGL